MNSFRPFSVNLISGVSPRFGWRRGHAFSLVEVLVALAIFAMAAMVLVGAFVNVLNAQNTALRRDENAAAFRMVREALCAEPVLENIERWNDMKLPDDGSGKWRATVEPTTVADLFQVTLEAEFDLGRGKDRITMSETFRLLRPTWSEGTDRETLRADARSKLAERRF